MAIDFDPGYNCRHGPVGAVTGGPDPAVFWVAAVEQLPADARGFCRTLRLHAVLVQDAQPADRAACGYEHGAGELRPDRLWATVTASGRCAVCELQLRRSAGAGAGAGVEAGADAPLSIELERTVDLDPPERDADRPRLSVVADEPRPADAEERRSPGRP